jgi:hypothetical protein
MTQEETKNEPKIFTMVGLARDAATNFEAKVKPMMVDEYGRVFFPKYLICRGRLFESDDFGESDVYYEVRVGECTEIA